jgi:hypothetical protein
MMRNAYKTLNYVGKRQLGKFDINGRIVLRWVLKE